MQSCCGMEFSREEKTGGHIWVPGPPTLSRCLPPEGFPTCHGPAAYFLSLGCCRPQLQGRICKSPVIILMWDGRGWGGGRRGTVHVESTVCVSQFRFYRGAEGARSDLKHIFLKRQNKTGTKPSRDICHSFHTQLSPPRPQINPLLSLQQSSKHGK